MNPILSNRLQQLDKVNFKMSKFLLLTPLDHNNFAETRNNQQMIDYLKTEFDCKVLKSLDVEGHTKYYVTHRNKEDLVLLCEEIGLDGLVIEYSNVYEQVESD